MLSSQPSSRNMESWKLISLSLSQNVFCQVNVKGVKTIVIIIVILTTLLSENRVLEIYFIVITIIIRHNCCLVNHYNSLNSWKKIMVIVAWSTWKYPSELLLPSEKVRRPWPQILPARNSDHNDVFADNGDYLYFLLFWGPTSFIFHPIDGGE